MAFATAPDPNDPNNYVLKPVLDRLFYQFSVLEGDGVPVAVQRQTSVGVYFTTDGLSLVDPNRNTWGVTTDIQLPASASEVRTIAGRFTDSDMDLDGDGRLSGQDVNAMPGIFGPVDGPSLFDLNGDQVIDARDQSILSTLVKEGLGAGVFADTTGDGAVDCGDYVDPAAHLGAHLGDPAYVAALDYDLDGELDETDLEWFRRKLLPGDIDANGVVDVGDLSRLLAAFGTCDGSPAFDPAADIDMDGCVSLSDQSVLLSNFGLSCP